MTALMTYQNKHLSYDRPPSATGAQKAEVLTALRLLGADEYDLLLPESHYLASVLGANETMLGVVYGKYTREGFSGASRGMLLITDFRLLLINKKPLYLYCDDIAFGDVTDVSFAEAGIAATVTLGTKQGPISFRTFNRRCGRQFVIEVDDMLQHQRGGYYDYAHK